MVIRMALHFEEEIVCKSMRSVPTMQNADFLVFTIGEKLPLKTIVLDIVNSL